jgi:hypothetical protein
VPSPADARVRGWVIPGIVGGIVLGTIIGSQLADHPGYYTYDEYDAAPPYGCPYGGYWARKAWRDEDGNVHYGRPRYFCR